MKSDPESNGNITTEDGYSFKIKGNPDTRSLDFLCKGQNDGIGGGWGGSTRMEGPIIVFDQFYQMASKRVVPVSKLFMLHEW